MEEDLNHLLQKELYDKISDMIPASWNMKNQKSSIKVVEEDISSFFKTKKTFYNKALINWKEE